MTMGWRGRLPVSMPANTSSDSALRRIRVARWSNRYRLAWVSRSCWPCSSWSSRAICRPRSTWSRRAILTDIAWTDLRRVACSFMLPVISAVSSLSAVPRRATWSFPLTSIRGSSMSSLWSSIMDAARWGSFSRTVTMALAMPEMPQVRRRANHHIAI